MGNKTRNETAISLTLTQALLRATATVRASELSPVEIRVIEIARRLLVEYVTIARLRDFRPDDTELTPITDLVIERAATDALRAAIVFEGPLREIRDRMGAPER